MTLFDPFVEFKFFGGQMASFEVLLKCHSLFLSKKCFRLRPAPSKCLSERINWIISTNPHRISKILVPMNFQQCWKSKLERPHFIKVQSGKITVCAQSKCARDVTKLLSLVFPLIYVRSKITLTKKSTFPTSQGQQNKHDLDLKRNYTVV